MLEVAGFIDKNLLLHALLVESPVGIYTRFVCKCLLQVLTSVSATSINANFKAWIVPDHS